MVDNEGGWDCFREREGIIALILVNLFLLLVFLAFGRADAQFCCVET